MLMGVGFLGSFLVVILIAVLVLVLIGWKPQNNQTINKPDPANENTRDILAKRYAVGEIDKDEFDQIRKDLNNSRMNL